MAHRKKELYPILIKSLSVALLLWTTLWVAEIFPAIHVTIYLSQYGAVFIAIVTVLIILLFPGRRGAANGRLAWYDLALILMLVVPCGYTVFFSELIFEHYSMGSASNTEVIFGFCLIIGMLETTRRVAGLGMPILVLVFVVHLFIGSHLPGILFCRAFSLGRMMHWLYLSPDAIWGMPTYIASTIIITFVMFGQFVQASGAGKFFTESTMSLVGHYRGGPAKAAVISSSLLAAVNSSAVANVATTGIVTIPLMKRVGYTPSFAGGVEAASSTGGQLTPPVMAAVAFLIAEILGIPYFRVCIYAAIPAFFYYLSIFMQVHFAALRKDLKTLSGAELPGLTRVLAKGWPYMFPILVLMFLLFVLKYPPEKCAALSLISTIPVSFLRRETAFVPNNLVNTIEMGIRSALTPLIACSLAGVIIGSLALSGLGLKLSGSLVDITGGSAFALLVLAFLACFILGMGVTPLGVYVTVAILVCPALITLGMQPIGAHLFVFWAAVTSLVTPPVALAAFAAAPIAGATPWDTGWQAARLSFVAYLVPFLFFYRPEILLFGSVGTIAISIILVAMGITLLAASLENYLLVRGTLLMRAACLIGGVLLVIPVLLANIAGIFICLMLAVWQWRARTRECQI